MVLTRNCNALVAGSSPALSTTYGEVAQLVEQETQAHTSDGNPTLRG